MDDLGVPLFFETPIYIYIYIYIPLYNGISSSQVPPHCFCLFVLRKIAEGFIRELRNGKVPKSEKLGC